MANALNKHTEMSALGAQIYFWSRVAYVPVYAFGIPFIRTLLWDFVQLDVTLVLVWIGSHAGIWPPWAQMELRSSSPLMKATASAVRCGDRAGFFGMISECESA